MTALPQLRRRWFQGCALTLSVIVLSGCLVISWIAMKLHHAMDERAAVEKLEGAGSDVYFPPGVPREKARGGSWLGKLLGDESLFLHPHFVKLRSREGMEQLKWLPQLKMLSLDGTQVADAELEYVQGLRQLTDLSLENTQITDNGLKYVEGLTQLKTLSIKGTTVTDAALTYLQELTQLEALSLEGTHVTDLGLEHLTGLTQLEDLFLADTQVSDRGVRTLQSALPTCQIHRIPLRHDATRKE